jgi:serine/threonine-protein kinase
MRPGDVVGAYRVVKQIGAGGMGEVWLADHTMLGRRAAVKVLHPNYAVQPEVVNRFFNEARAAAAIADPGIVQIYDFGQHGDVAYIVMEMLDGETLDERRRRGITLPDALRIMRQVASSLGAAHARGIIHRDLKPENIFLVRDPEVAGGERAKILDFGIAKLAGNDTVKTGTSAVLGTPLFMSPEQCRGAGHVDLRSDVYSLGCVLFTVLANRPVFLAEGAGDLIVKHIMEPAPLLSSIVFVPPAIDDLVARCLEKDPDKRPSSAGELAMALAVLSTDPSISGVSIPVSRASYPSIATGLSATPVPLNAPTTLSGSGVGMVIPPAPRRGLRIGIVAAVLIVVGVIAAGVLAHGAHDASTEPASRPAIDAAIAAPPPPPPPVAIDAAVMTVPPPDAPALPDAAVPPAPPDAAIPSKPGVPHVKPPTHHVAPPVDRGD